MKLRILHIIIVLFIGHICFSQNDNDSIIISTVFNAKHCGYNEICFPNFELLNLSFTEETKNDTLILTFVYSSKDSVKVIKNDVVVAYYSLVKQKNLLQKNKTYSLSFKISDYKKFNFNNLILKVEKEEYFFNRTTSENNKEFKLYKIIKENRECNNCNKEIIKNKKRRNRYYNIL